MPLKLAILWIEVDAVEVPQDAGEDLQPPVYVHAESNMLLLVVADACRRIAPDQYVLAYYFAFCPFGIGHWLHGREVEFVWAMLLQVTAVLVGVGLPEQFNVLGHNKVWILYWRSKYLKD